MKNLTLINPYSDNSLTYNEFNQRYELTKEYCKNEFANTFADDGILERRIKLNTRIVYNYIDKHIATVNKNVVDFLLNKTEEGRKFILELLSQQMYADIETGYNDLGYQPNINFSGQDKDRKMIQESALCVAAEDVFYNSDIYFGIRLDYRMVFPYQYFMLLNGVK